MQPCRRGGRRSGGRGRCVDRCTVEKLASHGAAARNGIWNAGRSLDARKAGRSEEALELFGDKVRTKLQLNIQNVTENGHLQTIGVNPDGKGYAFRIIDPRQFVLTTTLEF